MRRIISKVFLVLVALGLSLIMLTNIEAKKVEIESYRIKSTMESYDLLSNYFVQEDDKTLVANPTLEEIQAGITISGAKNYELMASNSRLKLYLIKKTLNIAVIVDDEYIFAISLTLKPSLQPELYRKSNLLFLLAALIPIK